MCQIPILYFSLAADLRHASILHLFLCSVTPYRFYLWRRGLLHGDSAQPDRLEVVEVTGYDLSVSFADSSPGRGAKKNGNPLAPLLRGAVTRSVTERFVTPTNPCLQGRLTSIRAYFANYAVNGGDIT